MQAKARKNKNDTKAIKALLSKYGDVNKLVKALCGELLGSGVYRDVYAFSGFPEYVIKIERDMNKGIFANVTEWRNYIDNAEFKWLEQQLAPCILINQTGQVLVQRRVEHRARKEYPKFIHWIFTDVKLSNFGWIGNRFVCCDYSFLKMDLNVHKVQVAKWRK